MGGFKDDHILLEESRDKDLADALGVSWAELSRLNYEIDANTSDDGLIYGYVVTFKAGSDSRVLDEVQGLDENGTVSLSPWTFERSYHDSYELKAISEKIDHETSFLQELEATSKLQKLDIDDRLVRLILLRQIFVTIIGALETFLSDYFINRTLSSERYLEAFVSNHPELKKQKISLSEVYRAARDIKEKAQSIMLSTIYHNLPVVREMYSTTFSIQFPDISKVQKHVLKRHDLVHRNGKTTKGKLVKVDDKLIDAVRKDAKELVQELVKNMDSRLNWANDDFDDDIPF